ncbi:dethiobiotin synthase [Asaia astilbis]|uniref:dethiobiotin synthase n=1 Tax=Asaia astilbis TaxID=610244 RepID=UPI00046E69AD|nr:dethiobiotin synthase [Asaia astilbis]
MTEARREIAARFDSAEGYEGAARVQALAATKLADRLAKRYADRPAPGRILELGCGTGLLTRQLRRLFPDASLTALDLSPRMVERARASVPDAVFHVMDAEYPELDGPFDLICSNFCLQWFSNRHAAFARLSALLSPEGRIEVTTLARGSFAQWRSSCDDLDLACGFPDYPDHRALQAEWPSTLTGTWTIAPLTDPVASARQFLLELKSIGATTPRAGSHPLTTRDLRRVMQHFDRSAQSMDYQVAFGSAEKRRGFFVTGTDTGIGKTLVSAILTKALNATYWKPFQTGLSEEDGDTASVSGLAGLTPERLIPPAYAFQAPLSPQDAARLENVTVRPNDLTLPQANAPLVVEGAGGLMVPLNDDTLLIDWLTTLSLPVILVCRSGLGTINHTLLSLAALRERAIPIAGVVMSGVPNAGNRAAIEHFGNVTVLAEIPLLDDISPQRVAIEAEKLAETLRACGF